MKGGARKNLIQGPLTRLAISHGHRLLLGLGRTWRVRHVGNERVDGVRRGSGPVLYALSHGVLLPLAYTHRERGVQLLISESRDGEIITQITDRLGFHSVRGSSTRGGARAVIRMGARGREGFDLAITPDGPRGPRGTVSPGVLWVAARGEVPIVPVGVAADRAFRARSWDRFLVPAPGARVWVVYGPPLIIERGATEKRVAAGVDELERSLASVESEATEYARGRQDALNALRIPA